MLTYRSQAQKDADKARMARLLAALDATPMAFRLDDCDAWTIFGKHGAIRTYGPDKDDGYHILVEYETSMAQTHALKRIGFCQRPPIGNGVWLRKLPSADQARAIRKTVGIPQYRRMSETARAAALLNLRAPRGTFRDLTAK